MAAAHREIRVAAAAAAAENFKQLQLYNEHRVCPLSCQHVFHKHTHVCVCVRACVCLFVQICVHYVCMSDF